MHAFAHISSIHLICLRPLLKWRILDIKSLLEASNVDYQYKNFCITLAKLKRLNIINTFLNPLNKRKYVFLTTEGQSLFGPQYKNQLSLETIVHDLKVSEIGRGFIENGWISEIDLEHELTSKISKENKGNPVPDAVFKGRKKDVDFKIAFELELTQKSNQRIRDKWRYYVVEKHYDYILYYFISKPLMNSYLSLMNEDTFSSYKNKFMFFFDENLMSKKSDLKKVQGVFRDKDYLLSNLFS